MPWTVRRAGWSLELKLDREVAAGARRQRFTDLEEARRFVREFVGDEAQAASLHDIGRRALLGGFGELDLADALATALVAGHVVVVDRRTGARITPAARDKQPAAPPPDADIFEQLDKAQDLHWVEIQLVDEEGRGVANARYVIVGPDGHEHRGYTDGVGVARISRLPAGECKVAFPELDRRDWDLQ